MEDLNELILDRVYKAYRNCSLQTVMGINKVKFEQSLDEIYEEFGRKNMERFEFNKLVDDGLLMIGAIYSST
jgi:hypothetical protein